MSASNIFRSVISSCAFASIWLLSAFFAAPARCDVSEPWQMGFQDSASPIMEGLVNLHHDIMFILTVVMVFVMWMLGRTIYFFEGNPNPSKTVHAETLEIVWTVTPSVILMLIAVPSFALLYSMDEILDPAITIKCVGHQWYWSYEYSDYNSTDEDSINYDSYMVPTDDLESGQIRLLEVDNNVTIPTHTHIRFVCTAADVLHSWAVPSLGVKMDCVPGRLNQMTTFAKRQGTFYGQCSELCGVQHGFMPIVVNSTSVEDYINWIVNKIEEG
jgi:cytochrome c oxidase subunit 2